jgi:hypothetical protein
VVLLDLLGLRVLKDLLVLRVLRVLRATKVKLDLKALRESKVLSHTLLCLRPMSLQQL